MMGWHEHEQRLNRLAADARAEQPPELDVDRLRDALLVEFRAAAASGALSRRGSGRRIFERPALVASGLGVAAACVLAFGALWQLAGAPGGSPHPQAAATSGSAPVPARSEVAAVSAEMSPGQALTAGDTPLRVEHAAKATWVLSPGSSARLLSSTGGVLRVELDRGTLDASVVPSASAESFVVQAGRTEVAVRGTRFQVSLRGSVASVLVTEGAVQVRPIGESGGISLRAGMQADFVDGVVRADSLQSVPEEVAAAAEQALAEAASRPVHSATGGSAGSLRQAPGQIAIRQGRRVTRRQQTPPDSAPSEREDDVPEAPAELLEGASQVVTERIQGCFRQHTARRGELRIEASTQLALLVQPNGLILEVGLDPPLAPPVERCVAAELSGLDLGASPLGYRLRREIRLSR